MIPIPEMGDYCVHFGGGVEMTDASGKVWRGDGDTGVRSSLAPLLRLVGKHVSEANVDAGERLHLAFADWTRVVADRDTWEAHWPTGANLDEHWVPREGPNIP